MNSDRSATGQSGEALARTFLESRGLTFRAANVHSPFGEIDLILEDPANAELVFVEVKTRHGTAFGDPELSVTAQKRRKLRRLVDWYCARSRWNGQVRLDVVGIVLRAGQDPQITHTPYVD